MKKRNILYSLFLICAVVCLSFGLAACGSKPWLAATVDGTLPTGVKSFNFYERKTDKNGNEIDGAQKGNDLKFTVEFDVGYGIGEMKFFANGVEVTQKSKISNDSNTESWEFVVPKIKEEVTITFTGAPEKIAVGVKFEFNNGGVECEDMKFDFGEKKDMTLAELEAYLSEPVQCINGGELVFKATSPSGFLSISESNELEVVSTNYTKSGANFISERRFKIDVTKEYYLRLLEVRNVLNKDLCGLYIDGGEGEMKVFDFRDGITLTKTVTGVTSEVEAFSDMTDGMTLTCSGNFELAKEILEYLNENKSATPQILNEIYFSINNKQKIDLSNIQVDGNGKLVIKGVAPVWKYANGDNFYSYQIVIVGAEKYFEANAEKWVKVTSESGSFYTDAWNTAWDNRVFNAASSGTEITYVGPQGYGTAANETYYRAGELGVLVRIDPFFDRESEKTYVFTLCGRKATIKYTKQGDRVVAEKMSADDGLTVEITPAGESGQYGDAAKYASITFSISDFSEWTGFSFVVNN